MFLVKILLQLFQVSVSVSFLLLIGIALNDRFDIPYEIPLVFATIAYFITSYPILVVLTSIVIAIVVLGVFMAVGVIGFILPPFIVGKVMDIVDSYKHKKADN